VRWKICLADHLELADIQTAIGHLFADTISCQNAV
jgi:hypothetical protein